MIDKDRELPDGWELSTLAASATLVKAKVDPAQTPDVPYIGLEHVEAHTMRLLGHGVASDVKSTKTRFSAGDVLYGKLRPYLNKVARPDFDGVCSTDFLVFTESPDLDPGYLANYLNQMWMADRAHHLSNGVELPRVDWKSLSQLPITYPRSKVEQRAIVGRIDAVRQSQSSASSHLVSARRAIERFRQAILAAACSGRLTANWRDGHSPVESASSLIERSRRSLISQSRQRSAGEVSANPDWLVLPKSWQWAPLVDLAEIRGGIQKQPKRVPKSNSFPYLRVANVHRSRLDLSEIHRFELVNGELEIYRLEPGDLLVVEGNGSTSEIGRCALWNGEIANCVHQNHIIRVRCVEMDPRFVELYWNSPFGSREIASLAVTSAGLYSLSTRKIGAVLVPVAPLEEQREVVRRVCALFDIADRLRDRIDAAARRVERSSQAVLAKAFCGELLATSEKELV